MVKNSEICLIVIVLLATAPLAHLGTSSYLNNALPNIPHVKMSDGTSYSKGDKLAVSEHVLIVVNGKPYDQTQNISDNMLSEKYGEIKITTVKEITNTVTTMESIFNFKRIRFDGKSVVQYNQVLDANEYVKSPADDILNSKPVNNLDQKLSDALFKSMYTIQSNTNNEFVAIVSVADQFENDLSSFAHHAASSKDPTLLVLLLPLSGYILIRSEDVRIKYNKNQIFSFCFILILVASSTVTPFATSQNYWGMAYAESQNQTVANNVTPINSTSSVLPNVSNSTVTNVTILSANNASAHLSNQTILPNQTNFAIPRNLSQDLSTSLGIADNIAVLHNSAIPVQKNTELSTGVSISDDISILRNGTIPPVSESVTLSSSVGITDSITILRNGTIPPMQSSLGLSSDMSISDSVNATRIGITVPNAIKSWNFTSTNDTVGKVSVENNTLNLQGNGYLKQSINSTNTLNNFTISAWVKPDYSQGSPVFAVITKAGQFALNVNNNIAPYKTATFSIFDGIRWSTVNSTGMIQNWTHLAVTYNGTNITMYANGTKQDSLHLPGVLTITNDGHLTPVTPDNLSSNSDMVIGATIDTVRNYAMDKFSGQIKDVNFYNTLLSPSQIQQLYMQNAQGVPSPTSANVPIYEVVSMSDSIQALLNSGINSTSINGTSMNGTAINMTTLAVVPTITNLKSSYAMGDNPEFEFKIFKDSDIKKMKKIIKASIQHDGWNEKNTTITVTVIAPDGTEIPLKSEFKKMKEGNFDIKILSKKYGKPGLYTIKTTLVQNGKTYTTQDQYAWGLVSLNTQKSIYSPGDVANMTMVVLDSKGHPVCDANLSVTVTDPSSHITTLLSGVGISAGSECGLYNAKYATTIPGNYTVNVSATANSIQTNFDTSFLAQTNIPFDVIRTAQSKIDPVNNPNLFNVKIDVTSFVNQPGIVIKESVPSIFNVTTDAVVQTVGDAKVLTWNKNLAANKTSVLYSYTVPLVFPQLYALGPAQITYGNQTFTEARPWFVANDPASYPTTESDTLTMTDNPSTGNNPKDAIAINIKPSTGNTPKDTLALSDSPIVSHGSLHSVTVQDSLASQLSDKISTGTAPRDTISVSDEVLKGSTPSDTVTVTDSVSIPTSTFYPVTVQDSLASQLSDKISTGTAPSDTVTVTDLTNPTASKMAHLSDSMLLADALTKQSIKSLSESVGTTDTLSMQAVYSRSLSDSILMTDSIVKSTSKILNDQVLTSDSSTSAANLQSNQQLVETRQTSITMDSVKPELLVVSKNIALSSVTVPSTVTDPVINYAGVQQTNGSTTSVQITNPLTIIKYTNGDTMPDVKMAISANTTITSSTSWDGSLDLPTIQNSSTVSLPQSPNQVNTPQIIIKIGSDVQLSFNNPVRLVFVGQAGSRIGFFHSNPAVTEIISVCTSDSSSGIPSGANECKINVGADLIVWTNHFTGFATWSSSTSSTISSSTLGVPGGAGGGGVGAGPSGMGASSATSNSGGEGPYLKIQDISYDVCDKQVVRIQVGTDVNSTNPMVIIRTSLTGVVDAKLATDQPYAQENTNATVRKLVYEASISPKEKSFEVVALEAVGHNVFSVGKTVDVVGCNENLDFTNIESISPPTEIDVSAPKIFDVKFQVGNQTKTSSSENNHFVDSQPISVFAFIDSKSALDSAEIRFAKLGDNMTNYISIAMQASPLQISNTTYLMSGTIPKEMLSAPAISYWINVQNAAGKISESDHYTIGVKPNYDIDGNLELDARLTKTEGNTRQPQAYFTNTGTGPVYGSIVLLVDGNPVFISPTQVFGTGQNQVNLEWQVPVTGSTTQYTLQAVANIYGKSFETQSSMFSSFPGTVRMPLSKLNSIDSISIGNDTIGRAYLLHSSFDNHGMARFKVTAPDGTCVIGETKDCLVTNSTTGLGIGFKTVSIGDQIYQVRYSGSENSLERFTITSVDPIVGNWDVEIVSQSVPQNQIMNNVFLIVKYTDIDTSKITLYSK